MKVKHVMRHNQGTWNAIRSDMYRVDIRGGWPSSWILHGAHSEAVSCDYVGSELAYMQSAAGDLLAMKHKQNSNTSITHNEAEGPK